MKSTLYGLRCKYCQTFHTGGKPMVGGSGCVQCLLLNDLTGELWQAAAKALDASDPTSLAQIRRQLFADPVARAAYIENGLRRELANAFERERAARGWSLRTFAAHLGTSLAQVQRLLYRNKGGGITLHTIVRTADALGLEVKMEVKSR